MAEKRAQTAILGVAVAAVVNLLSKVLQNLWQMAVATAFRLSALLLPVIPTSWLDVSARGLLFVMCYLAFLLFSPGRELRTESAESFSNCSHPCTDASRVLHHLDQTLFRTVLILFGEK